MFKQLNNLRFRFILLASLGAPALLVWIAGYYAWENWRNYTMVRTTIEANTMADQIIAAAGLQALERGVASSLLSASGVAPEAGRQRLVTLRAKSDQLWQDAFATAGVLEKKAWCSRRRSSRASWPARPMPNCRQRASASIAV